LSGLRHSERPTVALALDTCVIVEGEALRRFRDVWRILEAFEDLSARRDAAIAAVHFRAEAEWEMGRRWWIASLAFNAVFWWPWGVAAQGFAVLVWAFLEGWGA
jgi:hypothetical protein